MAVPPSSVSDLDGTNGFTLRGESRGDYAGWSVAADGDFNGDGFRDLIVGAPRDDQGGTDAGAAYVIFGKAGGFGATVDLAEVAAGQGGFKLVGEAAGDRAGTSVAAAGDINGDGLSDLILGAPGAEDDGAAYVVFGKTGGFGTLDLGDVAAGQGGFKITGETEDDSSGDEAGFSVASLGDFDGDGFDDVIVGAPFWTPADYAGDDEPDGAAYVIFGKAGDFGTVDLDEVAAGEGGFRLTGGLRDVAGWSVASAGDVNGDGFDDAVVGAIGTDAPAPGSAFVLFGKAGGFGTVNLDDIAASGEGFEIIGQDQDYAGWSVASAGDVNGDGFDDLIIGAHWQGLLDGAYASNGAAYVVFGKAGGFGTVQLDDIAAGVGGFRLKGPDYGYAAASVAAAGDINGDDFDDIAVTGWRSDGSGGRAAAAYVVYGKADGFASMDLEDAASGGSGFTFIGTAGAGIGAHASSNKLLSAGDINGDGFDDLIFGNPAADANSGAAHVIFGGDFGAGETLAGTAGADSLAGGSGDDLLRGLGGADTLAGGPGADTLDGGGGSDTADYSDASLGVSVRLATGTTIGEGADRLLGIESVLGGSGDDRIVGDGAANLLEGNAGDDFLEGGRNDDTLQGGVGNDTLVGARDHDLLEGGAGLDHLRGNSGNDTLSGGDNNDRLVGGAGNDRLEGGGGADELHGESGRDTLEGGAAGDRLHGGVGADLLTGGAGDDRFFLTALGESGTGAATRDVISDFEVGVDVINLAKINAVQGGGGNAAFALIGGDGFTAAGQVRFVQDAANDRTLVEGNVDGDLAPDFQIELLGLHDLAVGDFVL